MCFTNAGARWNLPYKVAGLIGVCVQPWNILNQLYTYLGYFGSFLSALVGIMLCDYYVIRRRRINVQDLYKKDGQYRYHGGVNIVGMVSWILGTVPANIGSDYGYLFGVPTGFLVYYVLMKVWYLKKFPQAEVESGYSEEYLGISVGNDWIIEGYEDAAGAGNNEASVIADVDEAKAKQEDETHTNELVHALTAGGMFAAKEYEASAKDVMFNVQSQIILELAKKSPCIIVGRCSNYVLEQAVIPTFDIFVVADTNDRIHHIEERDHTNYERAKTYVRQTERRREAYFNYYTSYEWGNPQYYDICVNTSNIDLNELADHIAGYINITAPARKTA